MSKENEINEDELMKMMSHSFSEKRELPNTPTKEQTKSKKQVRKEVKKVIKKPKKDNEQSSYQERFLQKSDLTARKGKTVYIRSEYHEILTRVVQVIGDNKVAISDFLDHILKSHFSEFEAEIKKQFKENYKPIL